MMTKKDYIRAAEIVVHYRQEFGSDSSEGRILEQAFVSFFRGDNPSFDEYRFRDATRLRARRNGEAIYDIDDEGLRMTLDEVLEAFKITLEDDPPAKRIARLSKGGYVDLDMGAHGIFVVRRVL